ncbi:MAG: hypothetical protein ABSF44_05435 [Candidatus Bathyarchaeia archaeon]
MDRKEAVALLKELGTEHLIQPTFVLIKQRTPDSHQLQIKGDYDREEIELLLKNRKFSLEENKDYLIIFKP